MKTLYLQIIHLIKKTKVLAYGPFSIIYWIFHLRFLMASPTTWEFYKEVETKILWVNICTQNLEGVAISINKWWKTRYPAYKIRIVSKKEFELVKMQAEIKEQLNYSLVNIDAEYLIFAAIMRSIN